MSNKIDGKRVLITGGTGSLGQPLTKRLLTDYKPMSITIFSRDEYKQATMKAAFNYDPRLTFIPGDVQNYVAMASVLSGIDIVFNTAAMKRVEVCEEHPDEAMATNYIGASNIVRAIRELRLPVSVVVNIGSDKGAKPLNVYGMTKALQEARLLVANNECPLTRFVGVRYGNVMASRGSVIPIWLDQLANNKPITVTDPTMTRFLISLEDAIDTLLAALNHARPGEIYIPKLPASRIGDMAHVMANGCGIKVTGKGMGEKMHEVLVTEEESERTAFEDGYYVITKEAQKHPVLSGEYISKDHLIDMPELVELFSHYGFIKKERVLA